VWVKTVKELRERKLQKKRRRRRDKIVFGTLLRSNVKTPGRCSERWLKIVLFS